MIKKLFSSHKSNKNRQLQLGIDRPLERDRNHEHGGRSFYFFDFDDNVAFLTTKCFLFHKTTGEQLTVSSGEFAIHSSEIGKTGRYRDYMVLLDDRLGTFRDFRDNQSFLNRLFRKPQRFVGDIRVALELPDLQWKGPSWDCFYHAVFNKRPLSVITARGHHPKTIKSGIGELVHSGDLPYHPNFLAIYPVSHPPTRKNLGDSSMNLTVAELKRRAIHESVAKAFDKFGYSPHHRFGMSDDDPKNIELIHSAMEELKLEYPENSFFVIETSESGYTKTEVQSLTSGPARLDLEQFDLLVEEDRSVDPS